jgi:teichuronic acid biosynthesis glycosyltransferase TuaG
MLTVSIFCFLDSDDYWAANKVEEQLAHLNLSGADVCCTAYRHVGRGGKVLRNVVPPKDNISYDKLLDQNVIGCSTVMAKTSAIRDGRFKKVGHEDFCFWLDLLKEQRIRVVGLQKPLVDYRVLDSSLSRNKIKAAVWTWKVYRESQKLSFSESVQHFVVYAYKSSKKYLLSSTTSLH